MTKTLTEQWREGTLESGWYYIKDINNEIYIAQHYTYGPSICLDGEDILSPVPSYDEFVQQRDFVKDHQKVLIENMNLKQQLNEANEVIIYANNVIDAYEEIDAYLEKWGLK